MALKPAVELDELPFEEILDDLGVITQLYKIARKRSCSQRFYVRLLPKSYRIKAREKALNKHLLENLLPVAKTLTYFKLIHCEPKEMHFCNMKENVLGSRSLYLICINIIYCDDLYVPSVLSHEAVHAMGAIFSEEGLATLLGWEIDARMALAGHAQHRKSLYKCLRDAIFHTSYLKAKAIGQINKWENVVEELYPGEITKKIIDKEVENFEKAENGLFHNLSDYTLLPYLSIKGAVRHGTTFLFEEYDCFGSPQKEKVDIPAIVELWKEIMRK